MKHCVTSQNGLGFDIMQIQFFGPPRVNGVLSHLEYSWTATAHEAACNTPIAIFLRENNPSIKIKPPFGLWHSHRELNYVH